MYCTIIILTLSLNKVRNLIIYHLPSYLRLLFFASVIILPQIHGLAMFDGVGVAVFLCFSQFATTLKKVPRNPSKRKSKDG